MYTVQKYTMSYVKKREQSTIESRTIANKNDVVDFCKKYIGNSPVEFVCVIALTTNNKIIGFTKSEGATNQCAVYPSNVFRFLLSAGASSFILTHNHPGSTLHASQADWDITNKLFNAGKLLDIPMLDHIIVSENDFIALKSNAKWPGYHQLSIFN